MTELMQIVMQFLDGASIRHEPRGDASVMVQMAHAGGKWDVTFYDVNDCLAVTSVFPLNAPEPRRGAAAELLTRMNWALVIGAWEMDYADGEIRFKTSQPARSQTPTEEQVRDLWGINLGTFVEAWPALADVLFAERTPSEALAAWSARKAAQDEDARRAHAGGGDGAAGSPDAGDGAKGRPPVRGRSPEGERAVAAAKAILGQRPSDRLRDLGGAADGTADPTPTGDPTNN
jgi:hypothetical protein